MSLLIAPLEALTDPRLSDSERRVLLALYSFRNKNADTVWPSIDAISQRTHIADFGRISKITTSLVKKGWMEKKKSGFKGNNKYCLTVPECLDSANLANNASFEDENEPESPNSSILANSTKLDKSTPTNLANSTSTKVANFTKLNKQQIEHQIEQQNKHIQNHGALSLFEPEEETEQSPPPVAQKPKPRKSDQDMSNFDFSRWPVMPSAEDWQEILNIRKSGKKNTKVTQRIVNMLGDGFTRTVAAGFGFSESLDQMALRGWITIEPEYMHNIQKNQQFNRGINNAPAAKRTGEIDFSDTSWAKDIIGKPIRSLGGFGH